MEKTHLPFGSASGTASRLVTRISRSQSIYSMYNYGTQPVTASAVAQTRYPWKMRIVGLFFVQYYVCIPSTRSHILMQVSRSVLILMFIPMLVIRDDPMPILIARRHGPPRSSLIASIVSLKWVAKTIRRIAYVFVRHERVVQGTFYIASLLHKAFRS